MVNLTIQKLNFPNNGSISNQIYISLYIKGYYDPDSLYILIDSDVLVDVEGTILDSPLPVTSIDPFKYYVLKAVNELCNFEYTQPVLLKPHCPNGYVLSPDNTYCFYESTVPATPPTNSQNAVTVSGPNNYYYGIFGSLIFNPGYNVNGTGSFTQISYTNSFWVNGVGYPTYPSASNTSGPLNRSGVWTPTVANPQTVGFSICVNLPVSGVYYIGMGCDDFGQINIDGTTVLKQDKAALISYIQANGYPYPGGLDTQQICFNFWYIYPVTLTAGAHVIEIIGNNSSGTLPGAADLGCEIYNLTSAQIMAATSYISMGAGLIFSSKDYVGMPIQLGSGGIGYSCPTGYSLKFCDSPPDCIKITTTPILY